ncbi:MAG: glycosyltransferase [Gammaproteobacteria bacterium]|nr:glycosyltransferase [Gammaproteobacteria bacterium]
MRFSGLAATISRYAVRTCALFSNLPQPDPNPTTPAASAGARLDLLMLMEDYRRTYSQLLTTYDEPADYVTTAQRIFASGRFYGDAYRAALRARGLRADQVVPDCLPLQQRWAMEHPDLKPVAPLRRAWKRLTSNGNAATSLIRDAQIQFHQPRVLWVFSGVRTSATDLRRWRTHAGCILLWWSSPVRPRPYTEFDLVLCGIPSVANTLRERGAKVAPLAHAFDPRIHDRVRPPPHRCARVAFVGCLTGAHRSRIEYLEYLARHVDLDFYGYGLELLAPDSPLRAAYRGPAWGDTLHEIYSRYLVVFHRNIDVAGDEPSAKRLFEATGMGACLVLERGSGLSDYFEDGSEVMAYRSKQEALAIVLHLLANPDEAQAIGARGQQRTLSWHTYEQRTNELLEVIGLST